MESPITVGSPIYLLQSTEECWRCHTPQVVVALATYRLRDDDVDTLDAVTTLEDEPFLLSNIEELPPELVKAITTLHPRFRPHPSKTAGRTYYANCCECGANFGDYFLFNKPDGAFFPTTEEAAKTIRIRELPVTGTHEIQGTWGQGTGELIFEHGVREA